MMRKQSGDSAVLKESFNKNFFTNKFYNDCCDRGSCNCSLQMKAVLTNLNLLLFGVTITIIIMVGKAVAFSISLVSAVRAKSDSCYLQRQFSFSGIDHKFRFQEKNILPWCKGVAPQSLSRRILVSRRGESRQRRSH
jgi:hypothetical protein